MHLRCALQCHLSGNSGNSASQFWMIVNMLLWSTQATLATLMRPRKLQSVICLWKFRPEWKLRSMISPMRELSWSPLEPRTRPAKVFLCEDFRAFLRRRSFWRECSGDSGDMERTWGKCIAGRSGSSSESGSPTKVSNWTYTCGRAGDSWRRSMLLWR